MRAGSWQPPTNLPSGFSMTNPPRLGYLNITFIASREVWLYLAAVINLNSRKNVGWAMNKI